MPPAAPPKKNQDPQMNLDKVLPTSQITNVYGVKYGSYTEVLHNVNLHMYRAMDFKVLSCCLPHLFFVSTHSFIKLTS